MCNPNKLSMCVCDTGIVFDTKTENHFGPFSAVFTHTIPCTLHSTYPNTSINVFVLFFIFSFTRSSNRSIHFSARIKHILHHFAWSCFFPLFLIFLLQRTLWVDERACASVSGFVLLIVCLSDFSFKFIRSFFVCPLLVLFRVENEIYTQQRTRATATASE